MTSVKDEVNALSWYHEIDLGDGIVTPGQSSFKSIWSMIRQVRSTIDYKDKIVLDIGSYDGMFAFEAEKLGASLVVATDCCLRPFANFSVCHRALNSRVIPYYNVSPYDLERGLGVFLQESFSTSEPPYARLFDIAQHVGVLYHLRDPMLSLAQTRSVMKTGGLLLIETAGIEGEESKMVFNGNPKPGEHWGTCGAGHDAKPIQEKSSARFGKDTSFCWCVTVNCLKEMLIANLLELTATSIHKVTLQKSNGYTPIRICAIAKAVGYNAVDESYAAEMRRAYRNPGLTIHDYHTPTLL